MLNKLKQFRDGKEGTFLIAAGAGAFLTFFSVHIGGVLIVAAVGLTIYKISKR